MMRLSKRLTSSTKGMRKCSPGSKFESTILPPIDLMASCPSLTVKTLARTTRMTATSASSVYKIRFCISAPRARAQDPPGARPGSRGLRAGGTVIVSFGMAIDCGPGAISLSSGKYIMLLPFLVSTITLREFL